MDWTIKATQTPKMTRKTCAAMSFSKLVCIKYAFWPPWFINKVLINHIKISRVLLKELICLKLQWFRFENDSSVFLSPPLQINPKGIKKQTRNYIWEGTYPSWLQTGVENKIKWAAQADQEWYVLQIVIHLPSHKSLVFTSQLPKWSPSPL